MFSEPMCTGTESKMACCMFVHIIIHRAKDRACPCGNVHTKSRSVGNDIIKRKDDWLWNCMWCIYVVRGKELHIEQDIVHAHCG